MLTLWQSLICWIYFTIVGFLLVLFLSLYFCGLAVFVAISPDLHLFNDSISIYPLMFWLYVFMSFLKLLKEFQSTCMAFHAQDFTEFGISWRKLVTNRKWAPHSSHHHCSHVTSLNPENVSDHTLHFTLKLLLSAPEKSL